MTEKIEYRLLGPDDLSLLTGVAEGLFDHPVKREQAAAFLDDPGHMIVLALAGKMAVGLASGTVLLHPDKEPAFFINEVGVRGGWRRRGIGRAMTERLTEAARERGCKGVWLSTEPANAPALALYRALGGDEQHLVGFGWDRAFDL
ncbi:Ribosomal-protein-alanine acetyltransferase [Defluviimonas aquaemixtae]|uniref:Ribosomal-protein-alanine acetyltransferase n=1 Tax=Albidovulum aquaemixtae TaxID=1542388 RepID=A0A2R8BM03_9RHOB|nr:GNAT family N-acetyltransferase [Defluviimonas aquaemixtae]SPH24428.1 Ribosomal-protein-alanine acetyltransferase [Defluviimonas aquaemixtae]